MKLKSRLYLLTLTLISSHALAIPPLMRLLCQNPAMYKHVACLTTSLNNTVQITEKAWKKMSEIARQKDASGFVFSAMSGGCNGFNYQLKLMDDQIKAEIYAGEEKRTFVSPIVLEHEGVTFTIDPVSEDLLVGTTIDFQEEDYERGIFSSKFTFTPDKDLASACGCGVSFTKI